MLFPEGLHSYFPVVMMKRANAFLVVVITRLARLAVSLSCLVSLNQSHILRIICPVITDSKATADPKLVSTVGTHESSF